MRHSALPAIAATAISTLLGAQSPVARSTRPGCPAHSVATTDVGAQLGKFRRVAMPFSTKDLSKRDIRMVRKLVEAAQYVDSIYWHQSDPAGLALYDTLAGCAGSSDRLLRRYLMINGSRFDLLEGNKPFVAGASFEPGRSMYPAGITRAQIDAWVAAHPDTRTALLNPLAVVQRRGSDLVAVPYHVAYRQWLEPAAQALRDAASLSADSAFAGFLRLRADALLSDDYYRSDLAWVDLDDPKFDIILAPYETYLDDLMGVKGSYGAAVMIRNEAESRKLATFKKYVADIQDALPLSAADKPSVQGHRTPMEVMDTPYRSGDLRHGYQAVADNLPNDPRIHAEKGTKKIFFKNFMDARVNYVVLPIGRALMRPDQARLASMDGYLSVVVMHEICHGLGPAYAHTASGQADIRESIGAAFSGLEEAKADVVGLFALGWLMDRGVLPKSRSREYYASHLAGIFRTVRFGVAEAHSKAEMMQFNYFTEQGAIVRDEGTGRYAIDLARMPVAIASLAKELLEIEATGDRGRAERWFAKYGSMPPSLQAALAKTNRIPVDVDPVDAFTPAR